MKTRITIILITFLLIFSGCQTEKPAILADNQLRVYFFDVGQGDASLIRTPQGQNILIDGGPDNTIIEKLGRYLPVYDRLIDIMVITHPHADHLDGLIEVINRYQVERIFMTGVIHTSPAYLAWLKQIEQEKIRTKIIEQPEVLAIEDQLDLQFIFPITSFSGQRVDNLNNTSIVFKLLYKDKSILFTGDAEVEVEDQLVEQQVDLKADILKAGHHGSATSSSADFLAEVKPQKVIIQVGADNSFGHPSLRTLRRLERLGIEILRTDLLGDIRAWLDSQNSWHFEY